MINEEVKTYIDNSVLCWLATSSLEGEPNVSPKEMFTYQDDQTLLIANIASPNTIKNIQVNNKVCVSFVDVFTQKGFKLKGEAKIINKDDELFAVKAKYLIDLFSDVFPIKSMMEISISRVDKIIAPSYYLFPDTTEEGQIAAAMKTYKVKPIN